MGTFSSARNEFEDPDVPAEFDTGRNMRLAFQRGWLRGIWHDHATAGGRYDRPKMQRAFEAGHALALQQRRERGEVIP